MQGRLILRSGMRIRQSAHPRGFEFVLAPGSALVQIRSSRVGSSLALVIEDTGREAGTLARWVMAGAESLRSEADAEIRILCSDETASAWNGAVREFPWKNVAVSRFHGTVQGSLDWSAEGLKHSHRKIRILIVDDSKTIRSLLTHIFSLDPELEVAGAAESPAQAQGMIETLKPDVITLDIHMPGMDGVTFLKSYLPQYPIPTVMISSVTLAEGSAVLDALEFGAVDYIEKPRADQLESVALWMIEKVKAASMAQVKAHARGGSKSLAVVSRSAFGALDPKSLVVIGSSTGGTEALKQVLTQMPEQIPPMAIVQHIPEVFSKAFADRMNELCKFEVKEAADGDLLRPGLVLVAPGGKQMRLRQIGQDIRVSIDDSAPVNRHKPSVDVLFDSALELKGRKLVAAILTGMGGDGAKGIKKLKDAGAHTIAQNEKSCVVFGMPREAIRLGGVKQVLPLEEIADALLLASSQRKHAA